MMKLSEVAGQVKEALSVKPANVEKIKAGIWGLIGGAIIAMVIGFQWGGWATASTTQKISEEAVLKSQATICVAQFMKESKTKGTMAELQKMGSYDRADFIAKGGWDKMPGQKEAASGVSTACAEGLQALTETK